MNEWELPSHAYTTGVQSQSSDSRVETPVFGFVPRADGFPHSSFCTSFRRMTSVQSVFCVRHDRARDVQEERSQRPRRAAAPTGASGRDAPR